MQGNGSDKDPSCCFVSSTAHIVLTNVGACFIVKKIFLNLTRIEFINDAAHSFNKGLDAFEFANL